MHAKADTLSENCFRLNKFKTSTEKVFRVNVAQSKVSRSKFLLIAHFCECSENAGF